MYHHALLLLLFHNVVGFSCRLSHLFILSFLMRNRQRGACKEREKKEGREKKQTSSWQRNGATLASGGFACACVHDGFLCKGPVMQLHPEAPPPSRCQHLKVELVLISYAELLHHCLGTLPKPFHTVRTVIVPPPFIPTIREPKPASCVTSPSPPSTSPFTPTARKNSPTRTEISGPCSCSPPEPWQVRNIWRAPTSPTSPTQTCHTPPSQETLLD